MKVRDPERFEHIIQTAADLFGEFGYNGVRMEDIAVRAGVAKGTLYLYFKDKDDLFLALILKRLAHLLERIKERAAAISCPQEKLLAVVRESINYFRSQPHIFAVIERLDQSGSAAQMDALRANRERFLSFTSGIIEELVVDTSGPPVKPAIASRILCSMMRELLFQPPEEVDELPEQIVGFFLHGLRGTPAIAHQSFASSESVGASAP